MPASGNWIADQVTTCDGGSLVSRVTGALVKSIARHPGVAVVEMRAGLKPRIPDM